MHTPSCFRHAEGVVVSVPIRVIPGNALAVAGNMPFRGLDRFGVSFLNKFEVRLTTTTPHTLP